MNLSQGVFYQCLEHVHCQRSISALRLHIEIKCRVARQFLIMNSIARFVLLLLVGVHAAPIADTILNTITSNCPMGSVRPSQFCVAHIEALFAMEHLAGKPQPKDIVMGLLKAVRDSYIADSHIETALAASQRLGQLAPRDHTFVEENKRYLLWLEHASTPLSRSEAALPKLHDCPTQNRCTQIINAALLHQHLRIQGGRTITHPSFVNDQMGMGLVVERDVKPGDTLIVVPKDFTFYHAGTDGFGKDACWAELDRVERFAVRLLMAWNDLKWKRWKDHVASLFVGDTPEIIDIPATLTSEQLQILHHVNPFAAAWAKSQKVEWAETFTAVNSSLRKIVPAEAVTLEHWLWACAYALTRAENHALVPYVEMMNHSPDGESLVQSSTGDHFMQATRHYKRGEQVFFQYYAPPGELVFAFITWGVVWEDFLPKGAFAWFFGMVGNASTWDRVAEALEDHDWEWRVAAVGAGEGLLRICRALYMEEEDMEHIDKLLVSEEVSPRNELLASREQWDQLYRLQLSAKDALPILEAAPSPRLDRIWQLHRAQSAILGDALASAALRYTSLYQAARSEVNRTRYPYIPPRIVPAPSAQDEEQWRRYRGRYVRTTLQSPTDAHPEALLKVMELHED